MLPSPHLKDGDLRGNLLVNVHTSVLAYGEWSNSHVAMGQVLVSNRSQMPHLSSYSCSPGGGQWGIILIGA